jgi:hypothetical protein
MHPFDRLNTTLELISLRNRWSYFVCTNCKSVVHVRAAAVPGQVPPSTMEELSTSVPRDRSGSVAFSSCRISLVTLVLAAAAAALITLLFWYMLVRPRSWTCACLLRLSWSVPRVAYNEVVSCDAGHNLWKLLTGSVWFGQHSYPCMSRLSESQACRLSYVQVLYMC